jgi:hypothetical protein
MQQPQLEPLSVGRILDVAFGLYRALFAPLLIVTLATASLPLAVSTYIEAAGGPFEHPQLFLGNLVLNVVLGSIGTAAATIIVAEHYVGRAINAGEAFGRATPFLGRVIGAALLDAANRTRPAAVHHSGNHRDHGLAVPRRRSWWRTWIPHSLR